VLCCPVVCLYVLGSVLCCPVVCLYVLGSVLCCPVVCLYVLGSVLCCPVVCLYVRGSVLCCPLCVFTFLVLCCVVRCDFRIETMFHAFDCLWRGTHVLVCICACLRVGMPNILSYQMSLRSGFCFVVLAVASAWK
jgi:hypothetical protein